MGLVFHKLLEFQEAQSIIMKNASAIDEIENIPLVQSCGRISATDVHSMNNLPLFTRSQVDGFAVIASDTMKASYNSPVKLRMAGETNIGEPAVKFTGKKTCIKVPTGGVIPVGADAVVPFEDTEEFENTISIFRPVVKFNELSSAGIDVIKGEKIIGKYMMVDLRNVAVAAATGIYSIDVLRKLKIGIISTGNELLVPGSKYLQGKVYDSNGLSLETGLNRYSAFEIKNYGIIQDNYDDIKNAIEKSISENDVTLTIGSTSAGEHDMVYKILGEYKPGILFHGIRVKPGKPALFARSGKKIIFGLPGFPVSSMMIFYSLVLPALFKMLNCNYHMLSVDAITAERFELHNGNTDLLLVKLFKKENSYHAFQARGNSGSISRVSKATGYSIINSKSEYLGVNSKISVNLFSPEIAEILIAGQYLPLMENMPYTVTNNSIFVEQGYNEIIKSFSSGIADAIVWNYPELPEPGNYEAVAHTDIHYGYIYSKRDYADIALLYNGSGLNKMPSNLKNNASKIYLGNPQIICDYVANLRCDAGITYKIYADMYGLDYSDIGINRFYIYLNRSSGHYNDLKDAFDKLGFK
ncbi:MAG: molybdopterin molybdotransferase MoeA [Ferroplasma sp.]